MVLRWITLMAWVVIVTMWLPETWFSGCTIPKCHTHFCPHVEPKFGQYPWYAWAESSTNSLIQSLKQGKGFQHYQWANLVVYFGLVPGWGLFNGWLHKQPWTWYVGMIGSVGLLCVIGQFSSAVGSMPKGNWYYYCTEFCMRVGNATGLTYGGVCFLLFVVAIPSVLIGDTIWGVWRRVRGVQVETSGQS